MTREPLIFAHPDAAKRAAEKKLCQRPDLRQLCVIQWLAGGYVYRPAHRAQTLVENHRARIVARVRVDEVTL